MFKVRAKYAPVAFLIIAVLSPSKGILAGQPQASTHKKNPGAMKKFEALLALGRHPQRITVPNIEAEFGTVLNPDSCGDEQWSCRWGAEVLKDQPSLTNLDLPNIKISKYRFGGNMLMEFPRDTCLKLEDVSNKIRARPTFSSSPPALQAFTQRDDALPNEEIVIFDKIPGMDEQVRVTAWISGVCLARAEVNALIK